MQFAHKMSQLSTDQFWNLFLKICLSHYELYKAQPFHLTMTCKVVDMVGIVVATEGVVEVNTVEVDVGW